METKISSLTCSLYIFFPVYLFVVEFMDKANRVTGFYSMISLLIMIVVGHIMDLKEIQCQILDVFETDSMKADHFVGNIQYLVE